MKPTPPFEEIVRLRIVHRVPGTDRVHLDRGRSVPRGRAHPRRAGARLALSPAHHVESGRGVPPVLVARAGFDILDDDPRSREIAARTIEFLRAHLARPQAGLVAWWRD